jgi:hypothetical protein
LGGQLETKKQSMQIQLAAYGDFAKAQAAWQRASVSPATTDAQLKKFKDAVIDPASTDAQLKKMISDAMIDQAAITDAKLKLRDAVFRIVLFSPAEVVNALAAFTQTTLEEECVLKEDEFDVYERMRRQIISEPVTKQDIAMALFGCKLK